MEILKTSREMLAACRAEKSGGRRLGFVPTMGALHEGHLSLVRAARQRCDAVAASIFVNPAQFGPHEDYTRYPRSFERDCELLEREGVALVFTPEAAEMYPPGASTWVTVEGLSERLDGRSRPGHFRGVATIVSKLFHIVEPDLAFFGQKDAAQAAIIRKMVREQDFAVEIVVSPIVREPDGLAMSSRNAYLSPEERRQATALSRALRHAEKLYADGEHQAAKLLAAGKSVLGESPLVRLDYFELVDADTLEPLAQAAPGALLAVAAWVGATRLIDNAVLP